MLEYLNELDTTALLAVNGLYGTFQDAFWWMVSAKWSSVLIALTLVWVLLHKNRRHALLLIAMVVLAIAIADQVSSSLIKHLAERLRPTREPSLDGMIHTVNGYRGGMFGFVSSHAANAFAATTLLSLVFRNRLVTCTMVMWATLLCYSRVYLGVHYPGDILGGIVVGITAGWLVWWLMQWMQRRFKIPAATYSAADSVLMASSAGITIIALLVAAACQTWWV